MNSGMSHAIAICTGPGSPTMGARVVERTGLIDCQKLDRRGTEDGLSAQPGGYVGCKGHRVYKNSLVRQYISVVCGNKHSSESEVQI